MQIINQFINHWSIDFLEWLKKKKNSAQTATLSSKHKSNVEKCVIYIIEQ